VFGKGGEKGEVRAHRKLRIMNWKLMNLSNPIKSKGV